MSLKSDLRCHNLGGCGVSNDLLTSVRTLRSNSALLTGGSDKARSSLLTTRAGGETPSHSAGTQLSATKGSNLLTSKALSSTVPKPKSSGKNLQALDKTLTTNSLLSGTQSQSSKLLTAVGITGSSYTPLTKLTSALRLTSCHLDTRPSCSALGGKSSILSKGSSLLNSSLSTTSSLGAAGKTGLSSLTTNSSLLYSTAGLQSSSILEKDVPNAKASSIRKRGIKSDMGDLIDVGSEIKRVRYDIDWASAAVDGDDEQIDMDVSLSEETKAKYERKDEAGAVKRKFVNAMSASLLRAPNFKAVQDKTRQDFVGMCDAVVEHDPEFILKVGIYSRKDLNIRGASSFLLAYAANQVKCRPFLKKYFKASVNLPSDWIEVAEIYQTFQNKALSFGALPTALRKVMVEKFPDFDKYQLGKYNKDKKKKVVNKSKGPSKREQKRAERHARSGIRPARVEADEDSDDEKEEELKTFTLKQLIRQLHINKPVDHVMCLIGKKYPSSRDEFYKLNLPGEYDETLAGKRMRLPTPETWETQISLKGNKAEVWQSLIDHKKLPFMAMLRNIRNMMKAGISEKHHQWVIGKLTDEGSIAHSKQFPFRFFSAYTVLNELENDYKNHQEKLIELAEKIEQREDNMETTAEKRAGKKKSQKQRRADQAYAAMKKKLKQDLKYDLSLVERYRKALDKSVELATNYNVPPIPGVTLMLCNVGSSMFKPCTTYKGLGQPRQVVEVGILLGLMCKHSCENSQLVLYADGNHQKTVSLNKNTGILGNTESLVTYAKACVSNSNFSSSDSPAAIPSNMFREILLDRRHIDNIIVLSDGLRYDGPDGAKIEEFLEVYRHLINPDVLFVSIDLSSNQTGVDAGLVSKHPNDVFLAGFSDQILRFVAERGDSGQMTLVDNIDIKYGLVMPTAKTNQSNADALAGIKPKQQEAKVERKQRRVNMANMGPPSKTLRWRVARVFISSTFLDMHGERDVLTRFVFPEIRQWAKKRMVNVLDVDLRWGVSQHATKQSGSLAMCLNEVEQADYVIAILGERYGWRTEAKDIPPGKDYDWMRQLPAGQSATALEIKLALRTKDRQNVMIQIRDPAFIDTLPRSQKIVFTEDAEGRSRLAQLKRQVSVSGCLVRRYSATWGGVIDNKPMASGLEDFALNVMIHMKTVISADYPIEEVYTDELQEIKSHQEGLIEAACEKFKGRKVTLKDFHRKGNNFLSGVALIHGEVGIGKTAFMARISHESEDPTFRHIVCTGYNNMTLVLRRLCQEISDSFSLPYQSAYDYYELVESLDDLLEQLSPLTTEAFVIMIDGLNYLSTENNANCVNWLPEKIPKNIVFLLSCVTGSEAHRVIARRDDVIQVELKPLELLDKSVIVKHHLSQHGKELDDTPFNNQLKILTGKKSATNPLYLMLACDQLRYHGVFEEVNSKLKSIPQTLPQLLDYILSTLEVDFGGEMITKLMRLFHCLPNGVTISDMRVMLAVSVSLGLSSMVSLQRAEYMFSQRSEELIVPSLIFTQILHRLSCLLDDYHTNSMLRLTYSSFKEAIRKRYIKSDVEQQTHCLIAGYYLSQIHTIRPEPGTTQYYRDIIYHLKWCGQFGKIKELLTSLAFLYCKCSLGLVTSINSDYSRDLPTVSSLVLRKWANTLADMEQFSAFVYKNTHHLIRSPTQLLQLAINEPDDSEISTAAYLVMDSLDISYVDWITKPQSLSKCLATLQLSTVVHCTSISPSGDLLALGGHDCRIHIYLLNTCEEKITLIGHANVITDLWFIDDEKLISASHDNSACLWDLNTGTRLAVMDKHNRRVSCCVSTKISILTSSWDGTVKMWTRGGRFKNDVCRVPCAINSMALHPDEIHAAVACWDNSIKVYNVLDNKRKAVLHGHKSSVRSIKYSHTGRFISSVALDGEVKLWSAINGSQMGSYEGHSLPVRDLCFSHDGDRVITAAEDSRVKVWSGQLGLCMDTYPEREDAPSNQNFHYIVCLAINSRCTQIAAGSNLGCLRKFDIGDLAVPLFEVTVEENRPITAVCWSTDNQEILCACDSGSIYRVYTMGRCERIETGSSMASCTSIATSSQWTIAYTDKHATVTVRSYDRENPDRLSNSKEHSGVIFSCSFNSSGNMLATAGQDTNIVIWSTGENVFSDGLICLTKIHNAHNDRITCVRFSDTVDQLASASLDCLVKLWDVGKVPTESDTILIDKPKQVLTGHETAVTSVSYRAGCVVSASMDGTLKVWSQKGNEVTSIKTQSGTINTCSLGVRIREQPEDQEEDTVTDWGGYMDYEDTLNLTTKRQKDKARMRADMVKNVLVAVGTAGGEVQLWNPLQANELDHYICTSAALSVCSTEDRVISSHKDCTVKVWNLAANLVQTNEEHTVGQRSDYHQITALARVQTGDFIISGSFDGQISVWGSESNMKPRLLHSIRCCDRAVSSIYVLKDSGAEGYELGVGSEDGLVYYVSLIRRGDKARLHFTTSWNPLELGQRKEEDKRPVLYIRGYQENKHGGYTDIKSYVLLGDNTGFIYIEPGRRPKVTHLQNDTKSSYGLNFIGGTTSLDLDDMKDLVSGGEEMIDRLSTPIESDEVVTCMVTADRSYESSWIGTSKGYIMFPKWSPTGAPIRHHDAPVTCLQLIHDESGLYVTNIISASTDCTVKMWDKHATKLLNKFICPAPITSMVCVPERRDAAYEGRDEHHPSSISSYDSEYMTGEESVITAIRIYIGDKLGNIHCLKYHPSSVFLQ